MMMNECTLTWRKS